MTKPQPLTAIEQAALTDARGRPLAIPEVGKGLSPRQLAFASLVAHGHSFKAAVLLAGYACASDASAKNFGSQMAADNRIAAVIEHFTAALLKATAPKALKTMTKIMQDPDAKDSDRIRAAGKVLDKVLPTRTSYDLAGRLQHEHQYHIEHSAPSLADLYREAGRTPPAHVLGPPEARAIDADFEEVMPSRNAVPSTPDDEDTWGV